MANKKTQEYQIGEIKVVIDKSKCLSCGACTVIAPKTFELDKDMMVRVKSSGPYDSPKAIKEAAEGCPVEAIRVEQASD